jgi:AraC-like DNA-binding protein
LRAFITHYAGFRLSGLPPGIHFGLPSRHVDLIISLGPPINVVQMPNSSQPPSTFAALVSGLQVAPACVQQSRDAFGLHVFIRPLGVRAVLGVSSAEVSSRVVSLSDIWGAQANDLSEMLLATNTWQDRFAILDQAFISKLNTSSPQPEIQWAWRRLAKTHGVHPVQQLANEVGYGRRHFSERFREAVGVAPKQAARVFRFEHACRLIAEKRPRLVQVAMACGYSDQAHLTREWYALAGCSPTAWIARELPFLQDYELAGGDNESDGVESVHQSCV